MADDSPAKGKLVPAVLELIALALVLGAEEAWRADKSWHQWVPEGIAGLASQIGVFTWSRFVSLFVTRNPWKQLEQAKVRVSELERQIEEKKKELPKLTIHSAFYGVGNSDDADITETLRNMIPLDGLAVRINNNLIAGRPDPAPNQPKTLTVAYSYGVDKNIQFSRPERALLVLPRDRELIEDTAREHDAERKGQIEALETKIQRLLEAQSAPDTQTRLIIHSAKYGPENGSFGSSDRDVLDTVLAHNHGNKVDMPVSGAEFHMETVGTPWVPGFPLPKYRIKVVYSYGNHYINATAVRYNCDQLILPEPGL